jgi:hypothetical protein
MMQNSDAKWTYQPVSSVVLHGSRPMVQQMEIIGIGDPTLNTSLPSRHRTCQALEIASPCAGDF